MASTVLACAKGSTAPSHYVASISSATVADDGDGDDEGDDDEGEGETSTSDGVDVPPASSDDGAPAESSGVAVESSGEVGSSDEGFAESSEDDGANTPPSSAWEDCDASACELGSDCVGVDGLRAFADFCAPQCEVADDCIPPPDGDAVPVCAIDVEGAGSSTHCALVCEVDGEPFGDCPTGMFCIDLPGQPTPVSLCMWP